jgi:hypothetical protein
MSEVDVVRPPPVNFRSLHRYTARLLGTYVTVAKPTI